MAPLFVETELLAEGRDRFEQAVILLNDAQPRRRPVQEKLRVAAYALGLGLRD